jgi:hypothetical protein
MGFFETDMNARDPGAHVTGNEECNSPVGGNVLGYCSCSDSVPRFVDMGSRRTTCTFLCANTPSMYPSDIPNLAGTPQSRSRADFTTMRLEKLVGAMGAFLVGGALMLYHFMNEKTVRVGKEKGLEEIIKATSIAPSVA